MEGLPERQYIDTAAGRVSFREAGAGENRPVLLALHGLGGNSATWQAQYAGLSDAWHVIGWDAPGYGETAVVAPDPAAFARLARAFLESLGISECAVIGHSMGGLVAQALAPGPEAKAGPEAEEAAGRPRVRQMILSCTFTGHARPTAEPLADIYRARIAMLEAEGSAAYAASCAERMVGEGAPAAVRATVREIARGVTPAGLRVCATMLHHGDTRPFAPAVACPVLLVSGALDRVVTRRRSDDLAALYPQARRVCLEGAGHAPYLESAGEYNALLGDFLSSGI